jgi:hypothetical protein
LLWEINDNYGCIWLLWKSTGYKALVDMEINGCYGKPLVDIEKTLVTIDRHWLQWKVTGC